MGNNPTPFTFPPSWHIGHTGNGEIQHGEEPHQAYLLKVADID